MIRYIAYFKENSTYSLFGNDYFNDKAIFNRHHHSNLIEFCTEVAAKGRPYKVVDKYRNEEYLFNNDAEFDKWYQINQCSEPNFGFKILESLVTKINDTDLKEKILEEAFKMINKSVDLIKIEIYNLKNEPKFNHWRIDGGYKELETHIKTSIESLKKIKEHNLLPLNVIENLNVIFQIPLMPLSNGFDLISYSRRSFEIDSKLLVDLLKQNLELIHYHKRELMKLINPDEYRPWWKFWN